MAGIIGDLEGVITSVRHVALGEKEKILSQARKRAEQVRQRGGEEAERVEREILSSARREAAVKKQKRMAEAIRQVRERFLNRREDLLKQVWREAESELRESWQEEPDPECLKRLALYGSRILGGGKLILRADPAGWEELSRERLQSWSDEATDELGTDVSLSRSDDPLDSWGGLMVIDADSDRRVDATFLLASKWLGRRCGRRFLNNLRQSHE